MRAVNDKLVRLSDVIETVKNQCSDRDNKWGDDNLPRPPYLYIFIDASKTIDELSDIPAVDAVPVVRCKDCEYWLNAEENEKGFVICPASGMEITEDDYCSYAERRSE